MIPQHLPCPCCEQPTHLIATEGESGRNLYRYAHLGRESHLCRASSGDWGDAESAAVAWQRRANPWVDIETAMPSSEEDVLILLQDTESWTITEGFYDGGGWVLGADAEGMLITHWMAVPDPPILTLSS